ncbi:ribose-5-phosphate isomerase RpiA [Bombilactobacillus bombi]|uniref:ribose-5-phosphate isomerase RpiA n=1 Tax=Bombilactobacillus bombi TaxID=1303590 RepID=UPI0015E5B185|nr:ribose-5-phosphate isomerase RpiA [Bombilactobacillus bombi]MBA1434152.1 ribose-5-phosphate isomerase RpiA [Bombilactobacillus bombi]
MNQDELKKAVGIKSVDFIKPNMTVGLGTGSTVYYMVEELGRRVQTENLTVQCVTTSTRTWQQAEKLGIPLKKLNEIQQIDITIDGADEIDQNFQGIKGGGGAHTYEKTVALNSKRNLWIVDQSKMVPTLGKFPLPIEVNPFGCEQLFKRLQSEDLHPQFRLTDNGQPYLTDMKNYIIDLHLGQIKHPHLLADWLDHQTGIIEHGLFLDLVNTVVVGTDHGPQIIDQIR